MKKVLLTCAMLGLFGFATAAHAEDKIALVSLQKAINEVEEGKRAMAAIQSEIGAKKKQLETLKTNLKAMREDVEKQKSVLSQDAMQKKMSEIQGKFLELQQKAMQYDQELKKKEGESVSKILAKLKLLVPEVAKKEGYNLVIENSSEVVLYSDKATDITPKIIAAYNSSAK